MFKQFVLLMSLILLVSACGDAGTAVPTATLLPIPEQDVVALPTTIPPTDTAVPTVTAVPEATAAETPTTEPTETVLPTPTESPTETPITQPELAIEPVTIALADGEQVVFSFEAMRFEPWLFFVEASEDLDTAVAVYPGSVNEETDLATLTAEAEADFTDSGLPELVVFTPDSDGEFSLVVTGVGEGTAVVQSVDSRMVEGTANSLAASEVSKGTFYSNITSANYIFVVPVGQADLALRAVTLNGELIAEANFGGPGSAEALFVLPPQSAGFHFEISEVNGETAEYYLFVGSGVSPDTDE